jgi:hypothetical protein
MKNEKLRVKNLRDMKLPSPYEMFFRVEFLLWRRAGDEAKG